MRSFAWPLLAALALIVNACGSDGQQTTDAGMDGGGRGGTTGADAGAGRGGGGGSVGGSTGGSTAGRGGGTAGSTGGATAGTGGGTAGSTGGSTAGRGGATAGTGGGTAGSTGGATAGTGGGTAGSTGGSTAGRGGATAGTGGGTAGSTGGLTAGTGGGTAGSSGGATAGRGGATAGTGGGTAGSTGGSTAGTGGSTGGSTAGTGGSTGGSTAGTGGGTAGSTGGSTAGTGGGTAGSTGGATAGTGGTAGVGGSGVACNDASTCPGGTDTDCQRKTCLSNVCGLDFTPANMPVTIQAPGDCHRDVCDGIGGVMSAILDSDTPADDGNACTGETCVNGLPSHPAEPARTACTQNGGMLCNGNQGAPACVICLLATDCPGTDTICHKRVCGNQNTCGFSNSAAGTDAEPDATGNCKKAVCDNAGGVTAVTDNSDVPADEGNACTDDVCSNGNPAHPAKQPDGTACTGPGGGVICSGATCVQCLTVANCPGSDTLCRQRACDGSHNCVNNDTAAGMPAEPDAIGNCHKALCDGSGGVTSAVDDTDVLVDGDVCTADKCSNGTASNPDLPPGAICASDGSKTCDAAGACNTLSFRVVRVGTGTGALGTTATAAFVEERRTNGTLVGTALALPTATSGAQRPLTMSGSATSEGGLSLSADGRYLVLAGYGTPPGTAAVIGTTSATVNRIAGRIDVAGSVDTSTAFATAFNSNNVRSAASTDGSELWIAGAGVTAATGGVWYNALGATSGETRVLASPDSIRHVSIFGNQLFATSASTPFVFRIGFATPTTAGQAAIMLPGTPPTTNALPAGTNPYAIAAFDITSAAGLDTLYVADADVGLRKLTFDGTSWTSAPTLNIAGNTGFRGVAGYAVGQTITLMASTAETAANRLVVFVDTGTGTPAGTVVATAATNTIFRGVAVSPHFPAP